MKREDFTKEIKGEMLLLIAEGKSLRSVCEKEGMPKASTFLSWCLDDKELSEQYARARDIQSDILADECLAIADDDSRDFGFKSVKNEDGDSAEVFINKDNIQRAKLRIDERHWQISKQRPKKYGDFQRNETDLKVAGSINIISTPLDESI